MPGRDYEFEIGRRYEIIYTDGRHVRFQFVGGFDPIALVEGSKTMRIEELLYSRGEIECIKTI